jgi:hypothetical protein
MVITYITKAFGYIISCISTHKYVCAIIADKNGEIYNNLGPASQKLLKWLYAASTKQTTHINTPSLMLYQVQHASYCAWTLFWQHSSEMLSAG